MADKTTATATLPNGAKVKIETTPLGGTSQTDVGLRSLKLDFDFKEITQVIEGIAESLSTTLEKIKPKKSTLEFGLEVGVEAGQVTALLVKGTGSATLKITLEWGEV